MLGFWFDRSRSRLLLFFRAWKVKIDVLTQVRTRVHLRVRCHLRISGLSRTVIHGYRSRFALLVGEEQREDYQAAQTNTSVGGPLPADEIRHACDDQRRGYGP